jgi:putative nucleotidyltransferase with HDIG domain
LFEGLNLHHRGRLIPVEISVGRMELPSGGSYVSVVRDITERKQAEESIRRHLTELEVLYETGMSINRVLEPKNIARKIVETLSHKLAWHHISIRSYRPETQHIELLAYTHPGLNADTMQPETERLNNAITKPGQGLSGWVIQHGQPVRCPQVSQDARYIETYEGVQSGVYVPMQVGERIIGVICVESERKDAFSEADERLLVTLAAQASIAMENARLFEDLQRSNLNLTLAYDDTILGWSQAMELRDKETEGHAERVTRMTLQLAHLMDIDQAEIEHIRRGALLHDIGKMGVPDSILLKPDSLTKEEWDIMQQHPVFAFEMLSSIEYLRPALAIPHYHHEKWDGSGYPDGLKAEQIPLQARLFAIVDVYDALTSDRPYRPAWTKERAIEYIRESSGYHFDPEVVDAFLRLMTTLTTHNLR